MQPLILEASSTVVGEDVVLLELESPQRLLREPLAVGQLLRVPAQALVCVGGLCKLRVNELVLPGQRLNVLRQLLALL